METSFPNWSAANIVGTIVLTALIGLPPLSCGVALAVQSSEMKTRRATILEMCNVAADAAARLGELPDVGAASPPAIEAPIGLPGLRAEYRTSERARQAYATCLDGRPFVPGLSAGTAEALPASGRRTR